MPPDRPTSYRQPLWFAAGPVLRQDFLACHVSTMDPVRIPGNRMFRNFPIATTPPTPCRFRMGGGQVGAIYTSREKILIIKEGFAGVFHFRISERAIPLPPIHPHPLTFPNASLLAAMLDGPGRPETKRPAATGDRPNPDNRSGHPPGYRFTQ